MPASDVSTIATGISEPNAVEILFEDDVLVAVNKPANMPVHRGGEHDDRPDLESILRARLGRELVLFHRLDADTTGVVLLGKDRSINSRMAAVFARKKILKTYWVVVRGMWQPGWARVETRIERGGGSRYRNVETGGQRALTTFRVLAANDERSWLEAQPKTGRTHQIRLHCKARGCPVLGDRLYGRSGPAPMALHAREVELLHPLTQQPLRICAPAPSYWDEIWLKGLTA